MRIDYLPDKPVISRFVAPWDASGWYYMESGLRRGSCIYANADIHVEDLPQCLEGCDYIVTFDSASEGFDDKQEVDFFVERRAEVYAALPKDTDAAFLAGFERTDFAVTTDAGDVYVLYMRAYAAGSHVHIDGFTGEGRHFFVVARPVDAQPEGELAQMERICVEERHKAPHLSWFVHDSFTRLGGDDLPQRYRCTGRVGLSQEGERRRLHLNEHSGIELRFQTSGQDVLEVALAVQAGSVEVALGDAVLIVSDRSICLPDGKAFEARQDGLYVLGMKRFPVEKQCEVWVNNRPAFCVPSACCTDAAFSVKTQQGAQASIDRIDWKDQTDRPFVDERWTSVPDCLLLSEGSRMEKLHHRAAGPCMRVEGSASYVFPAVSQEARIELIARADDAALNLMPELRDSRGNTLLRVAMYANNLFISDGTAWRRIVCGRSHWQYYPCGNWYHIAIVLDLRNRTFDVAVDGAVRAKQFALAGGEDVAQVVVSGSIEMLRLSVLDARTVSRGMLPPGPVFDVRDYGAMGDGHTLDTGAIQRAVDAASCVNGTVLLKDGEFCTKQINLKSDVVLWLDESAVLKGSQSFSTYPHVVPGNSLCAVRNVGRALVYGEHVHNVRLAGGGILDANGRCRFKVNDPRGINKLYTSRPDHIYIAYSDDIQITDVRLCNAAYWSLVPLSSRHILLEHLDLDCMNTPNRDGIDPVDCIDMTVRSCRIMAGDDGFCLKTADEVGCRNILAEDLVIQSLASGIKIGTDSYYGVEQVTVRRCILKNVNRCGIAVESVDGAHIRSLLFEDIDMTDCGGPMYLTIGHRARRADCFPARQGEMEDIHFRRIAYRKPYPFSRCRTVYESLIIGDSEANPIRHVCIEDCEITLPGGCDCQPDPPQPIGEKYPEYDRHGLSAGSAFSIRYAEDVQIRNCDIRLEKPDVRPLIFQYNE